MGELLGDKAQGGVAVAVLVIAAMAGVVFTEHSKNEQLIFCPVTDRAGARYPVPPCSVQLPHSATLGTLTRVHGQAPLTTNVGGRDCGSKI